MHFSFPNIKSRGGEEEARDAGTSQQHFSSVMDFPGEFWGQQEGQNGTNRMATRPNSGLEKTEGENETSFTNGVNIHNDLLPIDYSRRSEEFDKVLVVLKASQQVMLKDISKDVTTTASTTAFPPPLAAAPAPTIALQQMVEQTTTLEPEPRRETQNNVNMVIHLPTSKNND